MKSRARASFLRKTEKKKTVSPGSLLMVKLFSEQKRKKKYKGNYKYGIMHFPFF